MSDMQVSNKCRGVYVSSSKPERRRVVASSVANALMEAQMSLPRLVPRLSSNLFWSCPNSRAIDGSPPSGSYLFLKQAAHIDAVSQHRAPDLSPTEHTDDRSETVGRQKRPLDIVSSYLDQLCIMW